MTFFDSYLQPVLLSGDSNPFPFSAYRLDGTFPDPDLRRDAAVGSCHCCDYFFFSACGNLVLVEDSRLNAYVSRQQADFSYLNQKDRSRHIQSLICRENVLKVYGSLFVLYRFLHRSLSSKEGLKIESIQFWLVVNDDEKRDIIALDRIKSSLNRDLSSLLGKAVVSEVDIMTRKIFLLRFKKEASIS